MRACGPLPLVLKLPSSAVPFALALALTRHLSGSPGDGAMDFPSLGTSCKQRPGSSSPRTVVLRRAAGPRCSSAQSSCDLSRCPFRIPSYQLLLRVLRPALGTCATRRPFLRSGQRWEPQACPGAHSVRRAARSRVPRRGACRPRDGRLRCKPSKAVRA